MFCFPILFTHFVLVLTRARVHDFLFTSRPVAFTFSGQLLLFCSLANGWLDLATHVFSLADGQQENQECKQGEGRGMERQRAMFSFGLPD